MGYNVHQSVLMGWKHGETVPIFFPCLNRVRRFTGFLETGCSYCLTAREALSKCYQPRALIRSGTGATLRNSCDSPAAELFGPVLPCIAQLTPRIQIAVIALHSNKNVSSIISNSEFWNLIQSEWQIAFDETCMLLLDFTCWHNEDRQTSQEYSIGLYFPVSPTV